MLAMTYRAPYKIRVDKKPMPHIEHPNDAIIRVTRAAICGSDLHIYHGMIPDTRVGATFGHEFTGIVEEVGSSVQNLKVGDHVMVPFNIACGSCFFCKKSQFSNCHSTSPGSTVGAGFYGYSHTTGGYDGGQAEYVRVPFADVGPFIIPEWMHEEDALLLTDVGPTGYQAAEMGEIKEGDTVVVFGAGPVGLMAAKSAWFLGAGRVIVVDHVQYRLDFAQKWCPAEVINFKEFDDIVTHLKKVTDWRGADVCIDAVGAEAVGNKMDHFTGVITMLQAGSPTALDWCINSVRKNGVVSIVGVYGPTMNAIPIGSAMNKGLTLRMNQASPKRYIPHLMEHIKSGIFRPRDIITHRVPLEEIPDAYDMFANKRDNCIKTVVVPPTANLGSNLNPQTLH